MAPRAFKRRTGLFENAAELDQAPLDGAPDRSVGVLGAEELLEYLAGLVGALAHALGGADGVGLFQIQLLAVHFPVLEMDLALVVGDQVIGQAGGDEELADLVSAEDGVLDQPTGGFDLPHGPAMRVGLVEDARVAL